MCPGMTEKIDDGVANNVRLEDKLALLRHMI